MSQTTDTAYHHHDHTLCVKDALDTARQLCQQRNAKLTPLRQQVLELVWQNHQPLGAYELMSMLEDASDRRIAPPTVYRALEFLQELGLVHKIASLNAFIGCCQPKHPHPAHFMICQHCKVVQEITNNAVTEALQAAAADYQFQVTSSSVEIVGICPNCAGNAAI